MSLSILPLDTPARVEYVGACQTALWNRLLCMGLVQGTVVEVVNRAPLGDPIEIKALGARISLRLEEASHVMVVPAPNLPQG